MRTMTIRESRSGRKMTIHAKRTFQRSSGQWVALVDGKEFRKACSYLFQGLKNFPYENLHVQSDLDDDGKEYLVVSR